jgi:hypothetical protein
MKKRTFGVELEKPISDKTSQLPHGMTQKFYDEIETFAQKRDAHPHRHMSDVTLDITLGITSDDLGEQGLDNGFNLQESALPYTTDLHALNEKVSLDITTVAKALKKENATFLNMANHPFGKTKRPIKNLWHQKDCIRILTIEDIHIERALMRKHKIVQLLESIRKMQLMPYQS